MMQIPVVYINLDSDVVRRQRMEAEFEKFGIKAERLNAIRWTELSSAEQAGYYSAALNAHQYHAKLVNGEMGCYASHLKAWRKLLDSGNGFMAVLEDDVCLTESFEPAINALIKLDKAWDMVKLIGRQKEKVRSRRTLIDGFEVVEYARVPSYTAGYLVSRAGAEKLLASRQPFGRPIDVDLRFWWENQLSILGVVPGVLQLDETSSLTTISGRSMSKPLGQQWRKFKMKLALTFHNFYHRTRQGRTF